MRTRRGIKGGIVVESIIILIALGMLVKGGAIATATYKFENIAQYTDGTISGLGSYHFGVDVQFTVSQEAVVFRQNGFFFNRSLGDPIAVLYDAAHPQIAAVNEPLALWFNSLALGFGGLVFLAWGFRLRGRRSL